LTTQVLINGSADTHLDSADRGFTLGDGLFETIAVRQGNPMRWALHCARLEAGCRRLRLPPPDTGLLGEEAASVIPDGRDGVLRITLTRGMGARGYALPDPTRPTRVVRFTASQPSDPGTPVAIRRCSLRLAVQPALAGIKHLNRLEQIMARAEWTDAAVAEGLMFDTDGWLIEATASNVFLVRRDRLYTPPLDRCGVAGVMRSCVLAVADHHDIGYSVTRLGTNDLAETDEIFLTNTVSGIRPVGWLDGARYNAPGPVTQKLAARLADGTNCDCREK